MSHQWSHNSILGFTDTETVLLDFDNTTFKTAIYWARRAMKWFKLEGFLILKSSENSYHIVFNRKVSWSENMRITAWVAQLSRHEKLRDYQRMQCIKEGSTLRVSPKGEKQSPRIVYHEGSDDCQIADFLRYRKRIKDIMKQMS